MPTCHGCGTQVSSTEPCPVCKPTKRRRARNACPKCADALELQNWEGLVTYVCPTCLGSHFPGSNLEKVLDKLRAMVESVDIAVAMVDLARRAEQKPEAPKRRYPCPACLRDMTWCNYAEISGVLVQLCPQHGTWVDERTFADLAEFVSMVGAMYPGGTSEQREPVREKRVGGPPPRMLNLDRFIRKDDS